MVDAGVKIHLHNRGIHIFKQRQIFLTAHLPHIPVALPQKPYILADGWLFLYLSIPVLAGQLGKCDLYVLKTFQKPGGKGTALPVQYHIDCLGRGDGILIHTVGSQGVITVPNAYHLGADRDIVSAKPVRIPPAVPAFVMIAAYVIGVFQIFPVPHAVKVHQHLAALCGMAFHDFKFFLCQPPRLVEDCIGYGNLADIVHG